MIVSSVNVLTSNKSFRNMIEHVTNGDDNEQIIILDNDHEKISKSQLQLNMNYMLSLSKSRGDKFCMSQFMFNSKESMTLDSIYSFKQKICDEFKIDEDNHDIYTFLHKKKLQGGGFEYHCHFLTNYRGLENDRVINFSFSKMREEKLSRVFEFENGHKITQGKFNKQVLKQLKAEGYPRLEDMRKALLIDDKSLLGHKEANSRPHYSKSSYQKAKKEGDSKLFKDLQQEAHSLFKSCSTGEALQAKLKEQGFILRKGDKAAFILEKNGIVLGSAGKAFGVKNSLLSDILEGKKQITNRQEKVVDEKLQSFLKQGFTEKESKALISLENYMQKAEENYNKLKSHLYNLDDRDFLYNESKKDLVSQNQRISHHRILSNVEKIKDKFELKNLDIKDKIKTVHSKQLEYMSKIESIFNNKFSRDEKLVQKSGKPRKPQSLQSSLRELAADDKMRASQRFSSNEHEYTKIQGAAPSYVNQNKV